MQRSLGLPAKPFRHLSSSMYSPATIPFPQEHPLTNTPLGAQSLSLRQCWCLTSWDSSSPRAVQLADSAPPARPPTAGLPHPRAP
eukprot:scaffold7897_cov248-Pinguiococcus_pyrenoidosus.AAC.11